MLQQGQRTDSVTSMEETTMKTIRLGIWGGLFGGVLFLASGCSQMTGEKPWQQEGHSNLKQLAMAMHTYNGDLNHLPPQAIMSKDGKPLLSWRVAILPYLEEDALFKQFKLDEPWDSAHNKALLDKMPKVFQTYGTNPGPGMTFYQVFVSKPAAKPRAMFTFDGRSMTINQISTMDGTANTLMIAEAATPVPWTSPQDMEYDPNGPLPALGAFSKTKFMAVFGDGVPRVLRKDAPEKLLRQVITVDGGENDDITPLVER
jgi:hypothetical protein